MRRTNKLALKLLAQKAVGQFSYRTQKEYPYTVLAWGFTEDGEFSIVQRPAPDVKAEQIVLRNNISVTYSLEDYRNAPSGIGPLAQEWRDKPHRLLYDLIKRCEN